MTIETVREGEKGAARLRGGPLKRWLPSKRPPPDDTERIITYRSECCVACHLAAKAGAPELPEIEREYHWALERLAVLSPETLESVGEPWPRPRAYPEVSTGCA